MKRLLYLLLGFGMLIGCSLYSNDYFAKGSNDDEIIIAQTVNYEYQTSYDFATMSLEEIIMDIMGTFNLNESNFSIFYENTVTKESYTYNDETLMVGASTVKVAVNMMFYDANYAIDETSLLYSYDDYEDGGGYTSSMYAPGDYAPLSYLMEQSIVYSDNTAINIMIDELGFDYVRDALASYTSETYPDEFYYENLISNEILHEVLTQLYEHEDLYGDVLHHMQSATPNRYMKSSLQDVVIAHKYGEYGTYQHDFGIVYAEEPFYLGILTNGMQDGEGFIAYVTQVLYEYQMYHTTNHI